MDIGEKIKKIRDVEDVSQFDFCIETGINIATLRNVEQGRSRIGSNELLKITNHDRYKKYTLWLMTDDTSPPDQISPDIEQARLSETG